MQLRYFYIAELSMFDVAVEYIRVHNIFVFTYRCEYDINNRLDVDQGLNSGSTSELLIVGLRIYDDL